MITVREATGRDVAAVREIFLASYGTDYTDPRYYDDALLTRLVYSDESVLLVAEDTEMGKVVGTASVDLEVGAHSDLVGEFCRLAVQPAYRHRGIGTLLLSERLRRVQDRLQVGLVEARATHPYSLRIAEAHQFAVVGFLPERWRLRERESLALLVRYFDNALELRNNHPRIIPEVHPLAHMALGNCSLPPDAIVDEEAPAYPPGGDFEVQELTTEGYAALLRIARGRVRHREIFGPARLHYGIFKLQARRSRYLIAREGGRIAGPAGRSGTASSRSMSAEPGECVFREGEAGDRMHVVLQGEVAITVADSAAAVGMVWGGECLGEMCLLTASAHSATATARTHVETAVLGHQDLAELIRLRPDIGLHTYRSLAVGIGEKLKRLDVSLVER
jgi:ribosomal protein S18 acetylase RimI-like enzyme